jgi:serine/threonine protein kinase
LVGTVCYQSPELVICEKRDYTNNKLKYEYDDRIDSWSLGIMLTELAFGAHPYTPYIKTWNHFVVADCIEKLDTSKMIELCLRKYSDLLKFYIGKCLQKNFIIRAHCTDLKNSRFYRLYSNALSPEVVSEYLKSYQDLAKDFEVKF